MPQMRNATGGGRKAYANDPRFRFDGDADDRPLVCDEGNIMKTEKDMTLGTDWTGGDPAGWLVSEKYNGCRAYWDGTALWTRNGNAVKAPAWFTAALPKNMHLDGEIYAGYGKFTEARLATQCGRFTADIRFVVFDCPTAKGSWDERMKQVPATDKSYPVTFHKCEGRSELLNELAAVQGRGGEGLVIRRPDVSAYEKGRTVNLLKVKMKEIL